MGILRRRRLRVFSSLTLSLATVVVKFLDGERTPLRQDEYQPRGPRRQRRASWSDQPQCVSSLPLFEYHCGAWLRCPSGGETIRLTRPSPPLTEKENTFKTAAAFSHDKEIEPEVERVQSIDKDQHDDFNLDPFKPFDDLPEEGSRILTFRALFVGLCCGALVNASNVYLGLKTGWTFTANLFGVSSESTLPRISIAF